MCTPLPTFGQSCTTRCLDADCIAGACTRRPDGASCADEPSYYAYRPEDGGLCAGVCDATHTCVTGRSLGERCALVLQPPCARGLRCFGDANDHGVCAPATCP
jgi:hypothetical protein